MTLRRYTPAMPVRSTIALAWVLAAFAVPAHGSTPEATDPDVARCAAVLTRQLEAKGFAGRPVASVAADRAQASIDRWEERFSARHATKVATLIRVPIEVAYASGTAPSRARLEGRCGFTSGKLLASEIVAASS